MEAIKGKEPIAQIARKHQVSDAIIHKWRERFYEGNKSALNFEKWDNNFTQSGGGAEAAARHWRKGSDSKPSRIVKERRCLKSLKIGPDTNSRCRPNRKV